MDGNVFASACSVGTSRGQRGKGSIDAGLVVDEPLADEVTDDQAVAPKKPALTSRIKCFRVSGRDVVIERTIFRFNS